MRQNRADVSRNTRKTGTCYERAAGAYLEKQGYRILQYNFRCRHAEIDIIAQDGEYLVFCEVKYRTDGGIGSALEAVDSRKQRRISRAALYYMTVSGYANCPCRFDVVGISSGTFRLIKNAFDYMGE